MVKISCLWFSKIRLSSALFLASVGFSGISSANGINRTGVGAKSMATGGVAVANIDDSFAGMSVNPSLLGFLDEADFSSTFVGVVANGDYYNPRSGTGFLDGNTGWFPELSIRFPWRENVGIGLSVIPEQARLGDWVYTDTLGGVDGTTTYGRQHHRSSITGLRTALGIGVQITDTLSAGASVGLVYNENELTSPYIFQSHPALAGFKTLLALDTDGYGVNGDFGLTWRPTDDLTFGLAYRTPTKVESNGYASGDIGAQFRSLGLRGLDSEFLYDAEVVNHFPDQVSFGGSLKIADRTTISTEIDWIRWSNGFQDLRVDLSSGNNDVINGILGSSSIVDTIPLHWRDTVVYKVGVEHRLNETWSLRGGYKYGKSPIPVETLLPPTAAISEHTLTAGIAFERGPYEISLAYQHDLPASETISNSRILSGEYEGATIGVDAHWIALGVKYEF